MANFWLTSQPLAVALHIWVKQTAGGEAIPVTSGPDPDYEVDLSPDGTHIVFVSARGGGGIYIAPTLPGEPRLVVGGASGPLGFARVSPTGNKILYLTDNYKAFTVTVELIAKSVFLFPSAARLNFLTLHLRVIAA
jgi:Tol biopolymer transport system component